MVTLGTGGQPVTLYRRACTGQRLWPWFVSALLLVPLAGVLAQNGAFDEGAVPQTCTGHLNALYQALQRYAADHNGALPEHLSALWDDQYFKLTCRFFWCPEDVAPDRRPDEINRNASYALLGRQLVPTSEAVLLQEKEYRHRTPTGDPYRNQLLQNGSIVREVKATAVPQLLEPPKVAFDQGYQTVWDTTDCVNYRWHLVTTPPPGQDVEFQSNFAVGGVRPWTTNTAIALGRLRAGETYYLEVRARIGEVVGEIERVNFRVEPGARVSTMSSSERRARVKAKSPAQDPIASRWPIQATALRGVRIEGDRSDDDKAATSSRETTKPERSRPSGTRGRSDESKSNLDDAFVEDGDDPTQFVPRGLSRKKPLKIESPIETLIVTCTLSKTDESEVAESFKCELFCGGESISKPQKVDSTARFQAVYFQTNAASYPPGRYSIKITKEGELVCELGFNIVTAMPPKSMCQRRDPAVEPAAWVRTASKGLTIPRYGFQCGAPLPPPAPAPASERPTPKPGPAVVPPGNAAQSQPGTVPVIAPAVSDNGGKKPVTPPNAPYQPDPRNPKSAKYILTRK